ncbi:MAG: iron-sulfur cluster assembly scaffold protein NifU [Acidobacteriota bacterium]
MSELTDLYQEILLEHYRHPRNHGPLPGADREIDGHNPLCGDRIRLRLRLDGDRLAEVRFEGSGCAISTASASMMTEAVRGRSVAEALELAEQFREVMTKPGNEPLPETWGELAALEGVRAFPMRVKCATLAWHALRSALAENAGRVSTE